MTRIRFLLEGDTLTQTIHGPGKTCDTVFIPREQASKRADTGVHRCADLFIFAGICVSLDGCRNKSICRPPQGTTLLDAIGEACFVGRNLVNNPANSRAAADLRTISSQPNRSPFSVARALTLLPRGDGLQRGEQFFQEDSELLI
jgi:hypothetical protein